MDAMGRRSQPRLRIAFALAVLTVALLAPAAMAADETSTPEVTTQAADTTELVWKYRLAFAIAILTGVGTVLLIYYNFSRNHAGGVGEVQLALYMITIALIIEAVLICGILGVDSKQYEALYAAIAGYVLGSIGGKKGEKKNGADAAPAAPAPPADSDSDSDSDADADADASEETDAET